MRTQQMERIYMAALYLRLSKDDVDKGEGESQSIKNQRTLLQEYANRQGLMVVEEYIDDGYSGTNFDRPDFKRMIADIEAGRINCVLTKDFSRLGRNSARGLDYIDEWFPKHGVRYISVIDGYDSLHLTSGASMAAPMMMFVNEMYARDISNKIKSAFQTKMQKGEYISAFAPYGYQKDMDNKNHLVVDWQVAPVVQKIFGMAAEGYAPGEIAKYLNDQNIATPAVYRCLERPYLNLDDYTQRREWTSAMICKMLRNEVYLGRTVHGKTKKISFKSKEQTSNPRDEWIRVDGTHEPLISEELYNTVRSRSIARRNPPTKGFENIFSGIAKCADCGRNMTTAPSRKKGATYNLCCGGYKTYGAKECGNHFIDYDLLYSAVLRELQGWLSLSAEEKNSIITELQEEEIRDQQTRSGIVVQSLSKMEKDKMKIGVLIQKLYEDHAFGRVSTIMYDNLMKGYEEQLMSLEQSINELKIHFQTDTSTSDSYREFFSLLEEITVPQELTKPLLRKLIDRIEVEQGHFEKVANGKRVKKQKVKIYYRFIGCIHDEEKTS